MASANLYNVVGIDPIENKIKFYSMLEGDYSSIRLESIPYRARQFDEEFFKKFSAALNDYTMRAPSDKAPKITVVLPDSVVATDTVNIPSIKKRAMDSSLRIAIEGLYKNYKDMRIKTFAAARNKQYATYSLTMLDDNLLRSLYTACSTNKLVPETVTFSANALINSISQLRPKYRTASYLFVDMKEESTHFAFASKGRTVGYYSLPFGKNILKGNRIAAEDMLFDHSLAELVVLNAKEKARAKQLTVMGEEPHLDEDGRPNGAPSEASDDTKESEADVSAESGVPSDPLYTPEAASASSDAQRSVFKKTARKLPKFMLRPTPDTPEGFVYENFRIILKWALLLIRNNSAIMSYTKPEAVIVNLPVEYDYIFDMVNAERQENGIEFRRFDSETEANSAISDNLELFGGIYARRFNTSNNF